MLSSKLKPFYKWGLSAMLAFLFPISVFTQIAFTTQSSDLVVCGDPDTFSVTLSEQETLRVFF